jgi:hypothetical protein
VRLATGLALAGIAGRDEQAGDLAAARNAYEKLLTLGQSWAEAGLIVGGLEGLARSDLAHADPVGAAELLARAAWLRDAYDRPATAPERAAADRVAAQARTALGAQRYAEAANRGAAAAAGAAV